MLQLDEGGFYKLWFMLVCFSFKLAYLRTFDAMSVQNIWKLTTTFFSDNYFRVWQGNEGGFGKSLITVG